MERVRPWHPFRLRGLCGLKELMQEAKNYTSVVNIAENENETELLWIRRSTITLVTPVHGSAGEIITVTEGSSVKFNCNPFLRNCPYCAQPEYLGTSSTEYAQVYFCEHPCGWGEVKTYTRPANYGTDGRFRVAKRNQRGHNKDGMSVTIAGKYYCGIDRLGTDWYEVYTISWMSQRHGL
ncbi:hypothetical protein Q8A67_010862 [Cirrhinus molitorella]|uniref:Uncharacterized protein n=1 Tax=Cirrhinus molitorella TaxID=172907 RepID=A0AA88PQU1_9TELE|nr:hypothetical protein Q8A67_010862 [Cirrhinus molitorella]